MKEDDVAALFVEAKPLGFEIINTSHGESDYRETIIVDYDAGVLAEHFGSRLVIKLADNSFTDSERISMWKQCVSEYVKLGYYCPRIFASDSNSAGDIFPLVDYKGHRCIVYAEEYSKYRSADAIGQEKVSQNGYFTYIDDALRMNAKVASLHSDYTRLPSAYSMFELFDPSDGEDEVMFNAHEWLKLARKLPPRFLPRVEHIWERFLNDREKLRAIYGTLPRSVFQADINATNCLLDEDGNFKGVMDFNIAGSDVFINYLFREVPYVMTTDDYEVNDPDYDLKCIRHALKIAGEYYNFSKAEKEAMPLVFRCAKPLWYTQVEALERAGADMENIEKSISHTEYLQTTDFDFI